jgi:alpha-tubulin suppressor-like RCC1 family protein
MSTAYTLGEPWIGAMGVDHTAEPIKNLTSVPVLEKMDVSSIDCGWGHSVFLLSDHSALFVGRPFDFRNTLRHINVKAFSPGFQSLMLTLMSALFPVDVRPLQVRSPNEDDPFVSLSTSRGALTCLLTKSGKLYSIGQNFYGEAGINEPQAVTLFEPSLVNPTWDSGNGECITQVSVGFEHVLALSNEGQVFSWGRGDRGQTGLGDQGSYQSPARVLGPESAFLNMRFVKVQAGVSASAAIDSEGCVWVWGKLMGASPAGLDKEVLPPDALFPRRLTMPGSAWATAVDVSFGQAHCCILMSDNSIYMIGLKGRGLLFDESPQVDREASTVSERFVQEEPLQITSPLLQDVKIKELRSSIHYTYGITTEGKILRWGWKGIVTAPEEFKSPVNGLSVKDVRFGYCHSLVLI